MSDDLNTPNLCKLAALVVLFLATVSLASYSAVVHGFTVRDATYALATATAMIQLFLIWFNLCGIGKLLAERRAGDDSNDRSM